jgi:uncharacterized protein (DUF305 family)
MRVRSLAFAGALLAAVLSAGCSSTVDDSVGGPDKPATATAPALAPGAVITASAEHNSNDVMFLQMMIVHIGQGRELAGLATGHSTRPDVKDLAAAVEATQGEEVKIMTAWLEGWDEPTESSHDPTMHAAHGGLPAVGADQVTALRQARAADFDRMFLNLLIGHQHNAVELTNLVATEGRNPETKDLARRIKESRSDQISLMLRMTT